MADEVRVVGSVVEYIFAPEERNTALTRMVSADTKIVSITVTEKGYGHNPATGDLDTEHPSIAHDLSNPTTPITATGMIVEALRQRHESGRGGFTVLSCDNLQGNGEVVKKVVLQQAEAAQGGALRAWIEVKQKPTSNPNP